MENFELNDLTEQEEKLISLYRSNSFFRTDIHKIIIKNTGELPDKENLPE